MTLDNQSGADERETFTCDCGFQWLKGQNGRHNCSPFYRDQIDGFKQQIAALQAQPSAPAKPNAMPIYQICYDPDDGSSLAWVDCEESAYEYHKRNDGNDGNVLKVRKLNATPADMPASDAAIRKIALFANVLRDAAILIDRQGGNAKYIAEVLRGEGKPHFEPSAAQIESVRSAMNAAAPKECATAMTDDALECLRDVVSHHSVHLQALEHCKLEAKNDDGDEDDASYFDHEIAVLQRMKGQAERAISAAPQQPVAAISEPTLINSDERKAFDRFVECSDDGEGYDVPKPMMQRLAQIGVVRRTHGNFYETTEFGLSLLASTTVMQNEVK